MNKKQKKILTRIIISFILTVFFICLPFRGVLRFVAFMIPYMVIGYDILKKAFKGIIKGRAFDENFLMAIATLGAIALGDYVEGTAVMFFYQVGELFQSCAVGKSRRNIKELMDISSDTANLLCDNSQVITVDSQYVEVGSILVVGVGEKIPIDGVVVDGDSTLNTSALTGESLPRDVFVGDEVYSGSININKVIKIKTTKKFDDSTASKILELIENAGNKKSRSEKFISRFAKYYTPVVCISALILAILPSIVLLLLGHNANWLVWIKRALTFLVVSCPCALVISIPLSFFAGIGSASKEGILIKGSSYLEALSCAKYIVMDKTGTLTNGRFSVAGIYYNVISEDKLIEYAALAEFHSSHPISQCIKDACKVDLDVSRLGEVQEIAGIGVIAQIDGKQVAVGNSKLMEKLQIAFHNPEIAGTLIYVSISGQFVGVISILDILKPSSKAAISKFAELGISKTVMLSGDSKSIAQSIGEELSIDDVYSDLLPHEKVSIVEGLLVKLKNKEKLVYVGDGINDAPVLARADVGIAMGALGSDSAIEAADIVLMDDDPLKIVKAIKLAKKCMRIVYQNIFFAISVKFICLLLGAIGYANMWFAIFADVGVMVIAVLNAIRILKHNNE